MKEHRVEERYIGRSEEEKEAETGEREGMELYRTEKKRLPGREAVKRQFKQSQHIVRLVYAAYASMRS